MFPVVYLFQCVMTDDDQSRLETTLTTNLTADFATQQYANYDFVPDQWEKTVGIGLTLRAESGTISTVVDNVDETAHLIMEVLYRTGDKSIITVGTRSPGSDTLDMCHVEMRNSVGFHRLGLKLVLSPGDSIQIELTRDLTTKELTYIDSIFVTTMSSNITQWKPDWNQVEVSMVPCLKVASLERKFAIIAFVIGVAATISFLVFDTSIKHGMSIEYSPSHQLNEQANLTAFSH